MFSCWRPRKKIKTKIAYLMCLILVLSLFLCQSCDEEIKEKQQSKSGIGINKSSGTQSGSQRMLAVLGKGFNLTLCTRLCAQHLGTSGISSRQLIFDPLHSPPSTHTYTLASDIDCIALLCEYKNRSESFKRCWWC